MAAPAEAEACRQQLALSVRGLLLLGNNMAVLGRPEAAVGPTATPLYSLLLITNVFNQSQVTRHLQHFGGQKHGRMNTCPHSMRGNSRYCCGGGPQGEGAGGPPGCCGGGGPAGGGGCAGVTHTSVTQ